MQRNHLQRTGRGTSGRRTPETAGKARKRRSVRGQVGWLGLMILGLSCGMLLWTGAQADFEEKWNPEAHRSGFREGDREEAQYTVPETVEARELAEMKEEIYEREESYPKELLESMENNPELIPFVYEYLEKIGQISENLEIDPEQENWNAGVPLYLQWDPRWGYGTYGSDCIGTCGCGPTCLSMVYTALTADYTFTPAAAAVYAEKEGYYQPGEGTSWSLMREGAENMGLNSRELSLDLSVICRALDQGQKIICSMRPGDFTTQGHFIVIAGYDGENLLVNDPNSRIRSAQSWPWKRIQGQIRNLWALG